MIGDVALVNTLGMVLLALAMPPFVAVAEYGLADVISALILLFDFNAACAAICNAAAVAVCAVNCGAKFCPFAVVVAVLIAFSAVFCAPEASADAVVALLLAASAVAAAAAAAALVSVTVADALLLLLPEVALSDDVVVLFCVFFFVAGVDAVLCVVVLLLVSLRLVLLVVPESEEGGLAVALADC